MNLPNSINKMKLYIYYTISVCCVYVYTSQFQSSNLTKQTAFHDCCLTGCITAFDSVCFILEHNLSEEQKMETVKCYVRLIALMVFKNSCLFTCNSFNKIKCEVFNHFYSFLFFSRMECSCIVNCCMLTCFPDCSRQISPIVKQ